MHRIDTPSATTDNRFTEGSPTGGVPATTVAADWLNDLQENVCRVIEAAGIVLDKGNHDQLKQAIESLGGNVPDASTSVSGILKLATVAQIIAGSNNDSAVTPAGLKSFLPKRNFIANDYIRIPDMPGGLIIQFFTFTIAATANTPIQQVRSLPTAFPGGSFGIASGVQSASVSTLDTVSGSIGVSGLSQASVQIRSTVTQSVTMAGIAIGF